MFDEKSIPQKVKIFDWPYYLTIDGKVYRENSTKPLTPVKRRDGYSVTLCNNKKQKTFRMNNLMRIFYFNNTPLPIKHLNGCKTDFAYWNLKPMPRKEISIAERKNGWTAKAVIEILPDGTENIYPSAAECGRKNYVSDSTIRSWCSKRRKNTINENKYYYEKDYYKY